MFKRNRINDMFSNHTWMRVILILAGLFNLGWAILLIFFQPFYFNLVGLHEIQLPGIWRSSGIMAGVMGLGYLIASTNIMRYWPIVFMGLLLKLIMPLNILVSYNQGEIMADIFRIALTNHLIWWLPFIAILYRVYRQPYATDDELIEFAASDISTSLEMYSTSTGRSLLEASAENPVMLVFLRHFGCTFCRETLHDISKKIEQIEARGSKMVLIHMVSNAHAQRELTKFGLDHIEHVSDPESLLYKSFSLRRGGLSQLFSPKVLWRGIQAGFLKKHGLGDAAGDVFQMPGIFLIYNGEIKKQFYHSTAADIPPYLELAECSSCYE